MPEVNAKNDKHELWIRECLIPTVIDKHQTVNQTKKQNFKKATINRFTNDGGYLVTQCYKVILELDVDGDEKSIAFFVKISPELPEQDYEAIGFRTKFANETIAYKDILPLLGSPDDFPKLYYSKIDKFSAVVVISDFSADGFSMSKACVDLSLDHILASMQALGKFHGNSLALKFSDRKRFDELRKKMCQSLLHNRLHPMHEKAVKNGVRRALKYFRESDRAADVPETFLQRLENVLIEGDNLYEYMRSRAYPTEPLATICHGDFLRNNIAFAYDSNGLATKAMLFDFQTVLYASPMLDLSVFMANSTGYEIRQKHFDEIFRTYYDTVIEHFLDGTALNANDLPDYMRYDEFLKEYAIHMPYGFSIAGYFVGMLREPCDLFADDNFERLAEDVLTNGGAAVDHEMQAQIIDMYELHKKFYLNLLDD